MANQALPLARKEGERKPVRYTQMKRFAKAAAIDALIVVAAYLLMLSVRIQPTAEEIRLCVIFSLIMSFITILLMERLGVYKRIWPRTSGHDANVIIIAVLIATFALLFIDLIVLGVLIPSRRLPISVILIGNTIALGGFIAVRYRSRLIKSLIWRWRAIVHREFPEQLLATRTLIIGAGESGQALAMRLKHRVPGGEKYRLIGFIDDDTEKHGMILEGLPILGGREDIPRLAEIYRIELIVFAIHNIDGPSFRSVIEVCQETKARIKLVPDVLDVMSMSSKKGTELLRDVQPEDLIGRTVTTRHENVDLSPITDKVILVTGAAGSVGSEITRQLTTYNPKRLILLDNNESALHDLLIELKSKSPSLALVPCLADITICEHLSEVFEREKPQVIFHAAAYKHVPMLEDYPAEAMRVNVGGTRNVIEMALKQNVERFVLISTDKAVSPSNVMGASKRLCELLLHAYSNSKRADQRTLLTAVRFGNVLGSRGSVVPTFNRQIDSGGPITITHPDMKRFFMSISEAANLVIHAACMTKGDDIFVLKMGEEVRIQDLAERMIRLRGLRPWQDIRIIYTGIRAGEKLDEQLYDDKHEKPHATEHPYILGLSGWCEDFTPSQFLTSLDIVLATRLTSQSSVIEQMSSLIRISSPDFAIAAGD